MSILKVILHHWNKTTQSYDNFHPETEVSQVTDWNQGIVNTLASTALGGLVNTLTSDSLLAKMIQKVLEATGVKYSLGQNGYVCFGSLVGGLIIQWGKSLHGWVAFPVSYTLDRIVVLSHAGNDYMTTKAKEDNSLAGFTLDVDDNSTAFKDAQWLAVGK